MIRLLSVVILVVSCSPVPDGPYQDYPEETPCDKVKSWAYNHNSDICDCREDFGCEAIDEYCAKMARIEDGWE